MNKITKTQGFILFTILIFFVFTQSVFGGGGNESKPRAKTLDVALYEAAELIDSRIRHGTKIALVNINSPTERLSFYSLTELEANLLDFGGLIVVDRQQIDLIRSELNFQMSGEVSDRSMQELGQMLGAEHIVTGSITEVDGVYRLVVRILVVQSAAVAAQYRTDIANDARFQAVSGFRGEARASAEADRQASRQARDADKQAKDNFMARHPMKELRMGFGVHGGPAFGLTGDLTGAGTVNVMVEMGMGAVSLEGGLMFYPGINQDDIKDDPFINAEGESSRPGDVSLMGFGIGINYTMFGRKWLLNIGPGLYFMTHERTGYTDNTDEEKRYYEDMTFLIPYGQVRFDYRLTSYESGIGVYLRLGYRLDYNNDKMAKYNVYGGLDNSKDAWFVTHNVFAGMAFTMP